MQLQIDAACQRQMQYDYYRNMSNKTTPKTERIYQRIRKTEETFGTGVKMPSLNLKADLSQINQLTMLNNSPSGTLEPSKYGDSTSEDCLDEAPKG